MRYNSKLVRLKNRLQNSNPIKQKYWYVYKFLPHFKTFKYVGQYNSYTMALSHREDLINDGFTTKLKIVIK